MTNYILPLCVYVITCPYTKLNIGVVNLYQTSRSQNFIKKTHTYNIIVMKLPQPGILCSQPFPIMMQTYYQLDVLGEISVKFE